MNIVQVDKPQSDQPRILISGHDGKGVHVCVVDEDNDLTRVLINAEQARELSVRLLQAADLADPKCADRYYGGGRF